MREYGNYLFFLKGFLGNWYKSPMIYDGKKFFSSEQLFMYLKALFFNDYEIAEKILHCKSSFEAKELGRNVSNFKEEEWEIYREEAMFIACKNKFQQNIDLKEMLLITGNKILVEGNSHDYIWAVGLDFNDRLIENENNWKGLNLLGKCLMKVRSEII